MAIQRFISTSFWDDEWIQSLDPSEKLLYLYLMTNPLTTIAGVYEITVRRICFDTGFNSDTVKHILGKFEKAHKAFHHNGYIVIPAWPQHQKADIRPKIKQGIDAILKKLPQGMVEYIISVGYRYDIGSYVYDRNYSDSDSDSELDTDTDIESEPAPAKPSPTPPLPEKLRLGEFQNVRLSQEEYDKLIDRYEKRHVDAELEKMSAWMKSKGKVYKDHYAALLGWIKRDGISERVKRFEEIRPAIEEPGEEIDEEQRRELAAKMSKLFGRGRLPAKQEARV